MTGQQIGLTLAGLAYIESSSLARIELIYYDGWHPVASNAQLNPEGLNKQLQNNLPEDDNPGGCGYGDRDEAYAAAAKALGLVPIPVWTAEEIREAINAEVSKRQELVSQTTPWRIWEFFAICVLARLYFKKGDPPDA